MLYITECDGAKPSASTQTCTTHNTQQQLLTTEPARETETNGSYGSIRKEGKNNLIHKLAKSIRTTHQLRTNLLLEGTAKMRLREEPRWDCVLACLCRSRQTQSFDHVFDMELDCKLNFVETEPMSGHTRKQETESERQREERGRENERVCVFVGLFIEAVSVWIQQKYKLVCSVVHSDWFSSNSMLAKPQCFFGRAGVFIGGFFLDFHFEKKKTWKRRLP